MSKSAPVCHNLSGSLTVHMPVLLSSAASVFWKKTHPSVCRQKSPASPPHLSLKNTRIVQVQGLPYSRRLYPAVCGSIHKCLICCLQVHSKAFCKSPYTVLIHCHVFSKCSLFLSYCMAVSFVNARISLRSLLLSISSGTVCFFSDEIPLVKSK